MKQTTRRNFLKSSITAGLALGLPKMALGAERSSRGIGANEAIRLGVIGLGATTAVGGVGGRGHQLIARLREIPNARIAALCDVDQTHLDREARACKDLGPEGPTC